MDESKKNQILALGVLQELKEGILTSSVNPVWSSMNEEEKESFFQYLKNKNINYQNLNPAKVVKFILLMLYNL